MANNPEISRNGSEKLDPIEEFYGVTKTAPNYDGVKALLFAERIDPEVDLIIHRDIIIREAAKLIPDLRNRRVLDIGSGEGRWARFMAEKGAEVVGLEQSPLMVKIARERGDAGGKITYKTAEFLEYQDEEKYDFGTAIYLANSVKDIDFFFKKLSELLSEDAEFVLGTKTIEMPPESQENFENYLLPISEEGKYTIHTYPHSQADILEALQKNGFEMVQKFFQKSASEFSNGNLNELNGDIYDLVIEIKKRRGETSNS